MVEKITTRRVEVLELNELDSAQWSKGIKHELLTKSRKAHAEAKKAKSYKKVMAAGKKSKEKLRDPKGIRGTSKGKWGYYKGGKFRPD